MAFAENLSETMRIINDGNNPDLVISDMNVPGINGIELIKTLKEKIDRKIPILVISGMDRDYIKQTLLQIGISDFLIKPINRYELRLKILEYV